MDEKRHNELRDYLRWMANEMGLRDWTVTLSRKPCEDEEHQACILCTYGRKRLTVQLGKGFEHLSFEEQRQTFCHELIHAHYSGIEWAYNNLGDQVSGPMFKMVWDSIKDAVEFGTDALADVIAPHMPLPKKVKPKKKGKKAPAPKPDEQEAA